MASKILKWVLGIIIALAVIFFYGVVPWFLTGITTTGRFHFRDPNDGKTPASYGMGFSEVEFTTSDGIDLKGWYVPARGAPRGTIIYGHGLNRTRVEMLPMAAFAHQLGYNGVLFDLRHEGQSGGKMKSVGYWERLDAEAAMRFALDREHAARPAVLWGVSLGAAAALMAAAESPDVAAVISDSTFLSFRDTVVHHYRLFMGRYRPWWFPHLPAFPLADEVIYWAAYRANFNPSDFDLEKAVERINPRPILFVAVEGDQRMPPEIARRLYADSTSPLKQILVVPGTRHGEGFNQATAQYEQAVTDFLARVNPAVTTPAPTTVGR